MQELYTSQNKVSSGAGKVMTSKTPIKPTHEHHPKVSTPQHKGKTDQFNFDDKMKEDLKESKGSSEAVNILRKKVEMEERARRAAMSKNLDSQYMSQSEAGSFSEQIREESAYEDS